MTDKIERGTGRPPGGYSPDLISVTTVLRRKDPGGLMWWANRAGLRGQSLAEARKGSAGVGTAVHALIEAWIHGQEDEHQRVLDQAEDDGLPLEVVRAAYGAFRAWWEEMGLAIRATEIPLEDTALGIAGTLDVLLEDRAGHLWIGDWKTSKAVYPEMVAQLAAYAHLWTLNRGQSIAGGRIIRVSKGGTTHAHRYPDLSAGWDMFRALLDAEMAARRIKEIL